MVHGRRSVWLLAAAVPVTSPSTAMAMSPTPAGQDLAAALSGLASEKNVPLLFDRQLVKGLRAARFRQDQPIEKALRSALRGTGLGFATTSSGVFVVRRVAVAPPIEKRPIEPIADILVLGKSTSNADLPRSADDIQPYQVITGSSIDDSLAHTTSELLSEQVTMSLSPPASRASFQQFKVGSYVDLNGLGTDQTLVTVDGRRMPSIPGTSANISFPPPDINGIMPSAIDRVETLGTTAGAIFGIGATGGALNLVLKRNYRGFEVNIVNGISARGDDARRAIDAKAGLESANGRTKALIRVGYTQDGGDRLGDRSVGRQQLGLLQRVIPGSTDIIGNAIFIRSGDGQNLRFASQYGGMSLGQPTTSLPLNAPPLASGGLALLSANAGLPLQQLSPDGKGLFASLQPATTTLSLVASVRQQLGESVEIFADALVTRDSRTLTTAALNTTSITLAPGQGGNPFAQAIAVSYPTPGLLGRERDQYNVDRETLGAIVHLGRGWSANADISTGEARLNDRNAVAPPLVGAIDVFSGGAAFASELAALKVVPLLQTRARDRLYDGNVRAAGPLFSLPGGHATLTATGEWREDINPGAVAAEFFPGSPEADYVGGRQRVRAISGYLEARLPVLPADVGPRLLRGLALQLALRHDRYLTEVPGLGILGTAAGTVKNRAAVTSYTFGASIEPTPGVLLRASYAVGFEPPDAYEITPESVSFPSRVIIDPKRGGAAVRDSGEFQFALGGNPALGPEKGRTLSFGLVLKPAIVPGFRVSLDYNRLTISNAFTDFASANIDYFLAHEAEYPDRVIRAALTPADRALGYSAGKIEAIDTSILTTGLERVDAFDVAIGYHHPLGSGVFTVQGQATWEPRLTVRPAPGFPATNHAGLLNGPLKLRGSGSASWTSGPWEIVGNVQYYGSYTTRSVDDLLLASSVSSAAAVSSPVPVTRIAAKAYVDLAISHSSRISLGSRHASIRYRLGVRNLFDKGAQPVATANPPIITDPYSDLIGRRFELSIATKF